jgi:hypothetical protein
VISAVRRGKVTKTGWPYSKHPEFRYVEITTFRSERFRYFYVDSLVEVGDYILWGMATTPPPIGVAQDLTTLYPGITNHVHLEIISPDGEYIDPTPFVT